MIKHFGNDDGFLTAVIMLPEKRIGIIILINSDNAPPSASAVGGPITCLQTSVTIDGMTNALTPSWNWAGPGINAGNQMQENPMVLQAGTYTVTVTNTLNGCTNTATTAVTLNNTNPTASAGPNDTLTCTLPNLLLPGTGDGGRSRALPAASCSR